MTPPATMNPEALPQLRADQFSVNFVTMNNTKFPAPVKKQLFVLTVCHLMTLSISRLHIIDSRKLNEGGTVGEMIIGGDNRNYCIKTFTKPTYTDPR
jgi:hypothetical protein